MALDPSQRLFEFFAGTKRARRLPTLAIALAVTAIVAIPLTVRAVDARNDPEPIPPAADSASVLVDMADSDPAPLDGATVSGDVLISFSHPTAFGVSFNLLASGHAEPLVATQDLVGPQFDLVRSDRGGGRPLDTTLLDDGDYELFLTVTTPGGEQRTAVVFEVVNS